MILLLLLLEKLKSFLSLEPLLFFGFEFFPLEGVVLLKEELQVCGGGGCEG